MEFGAQGQKVARFGLYEADVRRRVLTRGGLKVRLQDQPFQVLALLLERPGELVTREEIQQKLWPADTHVAFDDGLNTAIKKLRSALSDTAANPRFIETVPRRGYRFVAPVNILPEPQLATRNQNQTERLSSFQVPETLAVDATPVVAERFRPGRVRYFRLAFGGLLLAGAVAAYLHLRAPSFHVTPSDTIVLADFVNTTGEAVFDDALPQGLEVGLKQSPFVQILSDRKVAVILKQMGRSPDARMTGRTAVDVCQRTGGKVTIQGSIASLGTTYLIGLAAIRCDNGEPVANEQVEAKRKKDVVEALGRASAQLRVRLGESLPSIQKYNAPLEQATTPSLEALNAYGMALSTWDKKGDQASIPFFKKAIELDPNFAMAHGALGTIYHNLGESALAKENTAKAYELRDRVTESERVTIESRYFMYVTGELEKAAEAYEISVHNYPQLATPLNQLGSIDSELGRYENAADSLSTALKLDPTRSMTYSNLAVNLLVLNRSKDAETVLEEAKNRKFQTDSLLEANYFRAFLRNDNAEMQRILVQSSDVPGAQALILSRQANTEAYHGRFRRADELSGEAANLMQHDGVKESAATCLAEAAVREAVVGQSAYARALIAQAQKLSHGEDVETLAAVVAAQVGELDRADALSRELHRESPSDTFVQRYWLPVVRAQMDLDRQQWSKAVSDLDSAAQLEFAWPTALSVATIYPAYVRGYAYLSTGDGIRAAAEFQKLIDHSSMVLNFPLAPLARLGQARAYACSHDSLRAHDAYRDFLQLWKDADPDLRIFKQATAEYAALR